MSPLREPHAEREEYFVIPPRHVMPNTKIPIKPEKRYTWEQWLAGRENRRRLGNLVARPIIRRESSSSDKRLRAAFDGERGPPFGKAFDKG